jgi:hypothetical protein
VLPVADIQALTFPSSRLPVRPSVAGGGHWLWVHSTFRPCFRLSFRIGIAFLRIVFLRIRTVNTRVNSVVNTSVNSVTRVNIGIDWRIATIALSIVDDTTVASVTVIPEKPKY